MRHPEVHGYILAIHPLVDFLPDDGWHMVGVGVEIRLKIKMIEFAFFTLCKNAAPVRIILNWHVWLLL